MTAARLANASVGPSDVIRMVFAMIRHQDDVARGGKGLWWESWGGVYASFKEFVAQARSTARPETPGPSDMRRDGGLSRPSLCLGEFGGVGDAAA